MSNRRYWKPHFVVTKHEIEGYYKCGLKEVHYEDDVPIMWTESFTTVDSIEEDQETAVESTKAMMVLYNSALENVVYEEYTEGNESKLRIYRN